MLQQLFLQFFQQFHSSFPMGFHQKFSFGLFSNSSEDLFKTFQDLFKSPIEIWRSLLSVGILCFIDIFEISFRNISRIIFRNLWTNSCYTFLKTSFGKVLVEFFKVLRMNIFEELLGKSVKESDQQLNGILSKFLN